MSAVSPGKVFGRLTVVIRAGTYRSPKGRTTPLWLCSCSCGESTTLQTSAIRSGGTRSCGCLSREVHSESLRRTAQEQATHGHARGNKTTAIYKCWRSMIDRCENPNLRAFKWYGARGIKVCERWRNSFTTFLADMGERPAPHLSLDRIDNNGNYEPGNCRWATWKQQMNNKRQRPRVFNKRPLAGSPEHRAQDDLSQPQYRSLPSDHFAPAELVKVRESMEDGE